MAFKSRALKKTADILARKVKVCQYPQMNQAVRTL